MLLTNASPPQRVAGNVLACLFVSRFVPLIGAESDHLHDAFSSAIVSQTMALNGDIRRYVKRFFPPVPSTPYVTAFVTVTPPAQLLGSAHNATAAGCLWDTQDWPGRTSGRAAAPCLDLGDRILHRVENEEG
jgi:hypothetical protein